MSGIYWWAGSPNGAQPATCKCRTTSMGLGPGLRTPSSSEAAGTSLCTIWLARRRPLAGSRLPCRLRRERTSRAQWPSTPALPHPTPFGLMSVSSGNSTGVNSGATTPVAAGQLVYAAEVTGVSSGSPRPWAAATGSPTPSGESTPQGSAFEEDITAGAGRRPIRHRHAGEIHRLVCGGGHVRAGFGLRQPGTERADRPCHHL